MSLPPADAAPNPYPSALIPHTGTEVAGDKFFPRQALAAAFDSAMTRTNGAMVFGLRRIGKSSEALACCERLRRAGQVVVKLDAQGITSEIGLLTAILGELPAEGWKDRLIKALGGNTSIAQTARDFLLRAAGGKPEDVLAYFGPIMQVVEEAIGDQKVVLVIDEFPWLCRSILQGDPVKGAGRVDLLLAALRRWRNRGVRMLLMGSIGMAALGRRYGLDLEHLNDLDRLDVPPLSAEEAAAMVRALAVGGRIASWTEAHTQALLEETVAFYPAMLQKGFEQTTLGGRAARLDDFPDLFADKVRPEFDDAYYQQFDKRLDLYRDLPPPLPAVLDGGLTAVMQADEPVRQTELLAALAPADEITAADLGGALDILREDGFLRVRVPKDGAQHWRPASDLVRAWWNQRRGGRRP